MRWKGSLTNIGQGRCRLAHNVVQGEQSADLDCLQRSLLDDIGQEMAAHLIEDLFQALLEVGRVVLNAYGGNSTQTAYGHLLVEVGTTIKTENGPVIRLNLIWREDMEESPTRAEKALHTSRG